MELPEEFKAVGREGALKTEDLEISVIILDARLRQNVVDYLIEPTAGTGKRWVESGKIQVKKERS